MTRRSAVEVVIARNGTLGPLHLAIPLGDGRYRAACRRLVAAPRVDVWTERTGGTVWGEARTCPDCADLGDEAADTLHLARLAGWVSA